MNKLPAAKAASNTSAIKKTNIDREIVIFGDLFIFLDYKFLSFSKNIFLRL